MKTIKKTNLKKNVLYYVLFIGALVATQTPFFVAKNAIAGEAATTQTRKRVKKVQPISAETKATITPRKAQNPRGASEKVQRPIRVTPTVKWTYNQDTKILEGKRDGLLVGKYPVKIAKVEGQLGKYLGTLPGSKNQLCGLEVQPIGTPRKERKRCGLLLDENRLDEMMPLTLHTTPAEEGMATIQ